MGSWSWVSFAVGALAGSVSVVAAIVAYAWWDALRHPGGWL